jgi:hypothetical protein
MGRGRGSKAQAPPHAGDAAQQGSAPAAGVSGSGSGGSLSGSGQAGGGRRAPGGAACPAAATSAAADSGQLNSPLFSSDAFRMKWVASWWIWGPAGSGGVRGGHAPPRRRDRTSPPPRPLPRRAPPQPAQLLQNPRLPEADDPRVVGGRRRGGGAAAPARAALAADRADPRGRQSQPLADPRAPPTPRPRRRNCPFAHAGELARRRPLDRNYSAELCPNARRGLPCPAGDDCGATGPPAAARAVACRCTEVPPRRCWVLLSGVKPPVQCQGRPPNPRLTPPRAPALRRPASLRALQL